MARSLTVVFLLVSLAASASDLTYTRKTTDNHAHGPMVFYFQGQRVRVDYRNEFGYDWKDGHPGTVAYGPRMATIYQCDMHRVLQLDFDHHQYTVTQLDRSGAPADPAPETSPPRATGAKVKVTIETRDTGETKQVLGYTARHFITTRKEVPSPGACTTAQEIVEDGWYIDLEVRPATCEAMQHPPVQQHFALLAAASCRQDYEVERSGPAPPPFPVDVKITSRSEENGAPVTHTVTEAVTNLSRLPLDPQIFDLPTGYKHVNKLDSSPNLPWLLRARLMWQSVKSTVWGWTPWGK